MSPPFNFSDILQQNECQKSQRVPFFRIFGTMRLPIKLLIFCFFFRKFFIKDSRESPFNFLKFCNRMDVKKSQRVPSFTVSGIVTFFKRNNFRVKIRFSQVRHAISDFCCFKRPVFFLCDFLKKIVSSKPLLNFCQKRNVLRELRTPQGFWHYATYRRPSKIFSKNFFLNFLLFKGFSLKKMSFFAVFSRGRMVLETCVSFRVFFGAVYCKIDEILMSFYPWFSL